MAKPKQTASWLKSGLNLFIIAAFLVLAFTIISKYSSAPRSIRSFIPVYIEPVCGAEASEPSTFLAKPSSSASHSSASTQDWSFDAQRDGQNYGLLLEQCDEAFPGLFVEIERQISSRKDDHITEEELSRNGQEWPWGTMRCMIFDGVLYVLEVSHSDMRRSRQFSTLLAISRALTASREKIPNIEFVISIEDFTVDETLPIWAYDRKAEQNKTWLMPDFGFWGWPEPGVGSYSEVRKRMQDVEKDYSSFAEKAQKLFWRGAIVPSVAPVLRQHLVDQVKGKSWADVAVLVWAEKDEDKKNRVSIEDHCKYQYLVNTEGRAWSGRLKYIQNCRSVVVAHKFDWIVPHEHLMVAEGDDQNYIQVKHDFSDINDKMEYYLSHPEEAERIADNNARTFRDRYLTPAAEACYWRKLIHGWAQVSFKPRFYADDGEWRGVPFDSYVLMRQLHWEPT